MRFGDELIIVDHEPRMLRPLVEVARERLREHQRRPVRHVHVFKLAEEMRRID